MKVRFNNRSYEVVFTEHAREQMLLRGLSEEDVLHVIQNGKQKAKPTKGKYWVFMHFPSRKDNLVCVAISIEPPNVIVITTLVNWSPK
ncbi:MAG: DUF4258 domain-containing protein [Deltaproteobacteria bacterium]|nr:DUF4258 domain-containing protein [Deltaproteobacteria bacterium]